ncbi:DUF2750 domain-containing protein [Litoribrevibacter albus]|uniref:DUF2750 domain-containing protein n=1 Tax=Litoribrevibacter albus TaxID=1473156 RepID=A0AA37W7M2_9GAMM|nr:DUF2750 domain-containing protein [Litoribrevibacter albus]GLQ32725.1 hypothetical protein GCM10007876_32040 [Litoribrevibacter albus]
MSDERSLDEQPLDANQLDCESRYDYFLTVVGEEREIWILINDDNQFLKIFSEEEDFEYLPVWPTSDLAKDYLEASGENLTPKSISLPEFLNRWVSGLQNDGLEVGVFPGADKSVWIIEPSELKSDIQDELADAW